MSNKTITLDLYEYEQMQRDLENHKEEIHKLETTKQVKVKNTYFYSLYQNSKDVFACHDAFTMTSYKICEDSLEEDLTKIEINNIKEINKANKLIKESMRFERFMKQVNSLDFIGRLSFLFTGDITLNDEIGE